ncbi:MAG: hypothetical protein DHS20C18_06380 [Saprospiraceae bacterium]|nr:MAG: hypothetical protein DHS20C18_06380 [Saprospiraceae bacterium]
MKSIVFFLFLTPCLNYAQADFSAITQAISAGNTEALVKYFDNSVEVAILDNEDVYNKAQAANVVKDFFSKYKPQSFSQVHQGTSRGNDSRYCIGNLVTNQATFRVYIYLKTDGQKSTIQELRFDKQ